MAESAKYRHWSAIVADQEQSGLTMRAYADQHDVKYHSLVYWRSRLRHGPSSTSSSPTFLEITPLLSALPVEGIAIRLARYDAQICVTDQTDLVRLRAVLEALC